MPRRKALPQSRDYDPTTNPSESIKSGLWKQREKIAGLLAVDLDEKENWRVQDLPIEPADQSIDAYIAHRKSCTGFEMVPLIDLVLHDLVGILFRFVVDLANLNGRPSYAKVYGTLRMIAGRSKITEKEIDRLSLRVQRRLFAEYVGGRENFRKGCVQSDHVIETARTLVEKLPRPKSGRPRASSNRAAVRMMKELVAVFSNVSSNRPGRTVDNRAVSEHETRHKESGNTLEFIKCVVSALPDEIRSQVTKSGGGLSSLLRRVLKQQRPVEKYPEATSAEAV